MHVRTRTNTRAHTHPIVQSMALGGILVRCFPQTRRGSAEQEDGGGCREPLHPCVCQVGEGEGSSPKREGVRGKSKASEERGGTGDRPKAAGWG